MEDNHIVYGWRYDLAEYELVRLTVNDLVETAMARDLLVIMDRQCADSMATDLDNAMLFMIRQTIFWVTLATKIIHSGYKKASPYSMATAIFGCPTRDMSAHSILSDFGVKLRVIEQEALRGGVLLSARAHERALQLVQVDIAVQMLTVIDVESIMAIFKAVNTTMWLSGDRNTWQLGLECCLKMFRVFSERVVPIAFTSLWIWKSHLRARRRPTEDLDERLGLWRVCLKLYALAAPMTPDDDNVRPDDLAGVFSGNISHTRSLIIDRPILSLTLKEFWATWSAIMWRTPGLQIGEDFHICVRLMALRCAELTCFTYDIATLDYPKYIRIPEGTLDNEHIDGIDDIMLSVNEAFLIDTERVFFYLFEASWTTAYLTPSTPVPHALSHHCQTWYGYIHETVSSQTASFIQLTLEDVGWWRYIYWDEIERFQVKRHARSFMPRKVLGDFRQSDSDAVYEILRGRNTLEMLWKSAVENTEREEEERAATVGGQLRGWTWKMTWDICKESAYRTNNAKNLPHNIDEIIDESTGREVYVYRHNRSKVRGKDLELIQMSKGIRMSASGFVEKNVLEQIAMGVVLNLRQDKHGQGQVLSIFSTYGNVPNSIEPKYMTLMHLLSRGTEPTHSIQREFNGDTPLLLSHLNRYFVLDGARVYANTMNLVDAVYAWCLVCENVVRHKLEAILERLSPDQPAEANDQLLREAKRTVATVPLVLRQIFDLVRDEYVMQPDPNHYAMPNTFRVNHCRWDETDIGRFFIDHHPNLNISQTLVTLRQMGRYTPSSNNDESADSEARAIANLMGDDSDNDNDDDATDFVAHSDILLTLGGTNW